MATDSNTLRKRLVLRGQVQGVGFRPFVYRLAHRLGLAGNVRNDANGATIEIEGTPTAINSFEPALRTELPPLAQITSLDETLLEPRGDADFRIIPSTNATDQRPEVTPDAATCGDCLRELFDPHDRRYRYPFINCTNCGPRYSIIRTVPYDRPSTTMSPFRMCPDCQREYDDPADRRFHAQPNACPVCGPQVALTDRHGTPLASRHTAIELAAGMLRDGRILAIKGIGGFHLACRADDASAVARLRERKLRDGKPLAVMVPNIDTAGCLCEMSKADIAILQSPAAPIVLMPRQPDATIAGNVAPGCRDLGLMLPYAPLQHVLFAEGIGPIVMTSANLSGRPLTYRDNDAQATLGDVAGAFLTHNREIFRPIDDSVLMTFRDEAIPIRRARGYAPRPMRIAEIRPQHAHDTTPKEPESPRILAVGAELKSTVCLLQNSEAVVSEHLGDLSQADTYRHFVAAIDRLAELCGFAPDIVACDMHPQYLSTRYARERGLPIITVQHHHAHIASAMAESGETGPVIGIACDGVGLGTDNTVWGCEVLRCERGDFERLGHLRPSPLLGGDAAAIETWRPAATLLRDAFGTDWAARMQPHLPQGLAQRVEQQLAAGVNAPQSSSLGRLFDAVAHLLGLCEQNRHEAEAAMALESAASEVEDNIEPFSFDIDDGPIGFQLSPIPMTRELVSARDSGTPAPLLAARFHETLAQMLAHAAGIAQESCGALPIALSGGCFANRRLLKRLCNLLQSRGNRVICHRRLPCGDGGISLGQALVAAWRVADAS